MSSNELGFEPLTREKLEVEGHVFYNMQEVTLDIAAYSRGLKKGSQSTVAPDGTVTKVEDTQKESGIILDKLNTLANERPEWMKVTDRMNAEREARVEELKHSRPDLYELRASYIRRDN